LTWGNFFLVNLLPVTIGNIIGGAVMVGLVYWFIYLRPLRRTQAETGSSEVTGLQGGPA
jgi:formate transporter